MVIEAVAVLLSLLAGLAIIGVVDISVGFLKWARRSALEDMPDDEDEDE